MQTASTTTQTDLMERSGAGRMSVEDVSIGADGATLAGRIYRPVGAAPPAAVIVLHGATGVPQGYYRWFAEWLATERGFACLTYDYRDFAASAVGPMAKARATKTDWGVRDQSAALDFARAAVPGCPLWVIGHSLGGTMTPFHANAHVIDRMITVASGPVFWTDHPWPYRALAFAFWFALGPISTRLLGYLPGRLAGLGSDLPAGVYWQWRRWCLSRDFTDADVGGALPAPAHAMTAPLKTIAFSDDDTIPPKCVRRLAARYPNAEASFEEIRPAELGLEAIGHLSAFTRRNRAVWPRLIA